MNRVSAPVSRSALGGPADQQHADLLQHQTDQAGGGDPADHRPVPGGEPQPRPQPQAEPEQRHGRGQRQRQHPDRGAQAEHRTSAVRPGGRPAKISVRDDHHELDSSGAAAAARNR